jgi:hypothetical protein
MPPSGLMNLEGFPQGAEVSFEQNFVKDDK